MLAAAYGAWEEMEVLVKGAALRTGTNLLPLIQNTSNERRVGGEETEEGKTHRQGASSHSYSSMDGGSSREGGATVAHVRLEDRDDDDALERWRKQREEASSPHGTNGGRGRSEGGGGDALERWRKQREEASSRAATSKISAQAIEHLLLESLDLIGAEEEKGGEGGGGPLFQNDDLNAVLPTRHDATKFNTRGGGWEEEIEATPRLVETSVQTSDDDDAARNSNSVVTANVCDVAPLSVAIEKFDTNAVQTLGEEEEQHEGKKEADQVSEAFNLLVSQSVHDMLFTAGPGEEHGEGKEEGKRDGSVFVPNALVVPHAEERLIRDSFSAASTMARGEEEAEGDDGVGSIREGGGGFPNHQEEMEMCGTTHSHHETGSNSEGASPRNELKDGENVPPPPPSIESESSLPSGSGGGGAVPTPKVVHLHHHFHPGSADVRMSFRAAPFGLHTPSMSMSGDSVVDNQPSPPEEEGGGEQAKEDFSFDSLKERVRMLELQLASLDGNC